MTITTEQEAKLRELLLNNMIDEDQLESDEEDDCAKYGEDGAIDSFERGEKYGAHDLAEAILAIIGLG